jgi:glycosyltransferase involved in cell wall biosynthesis
MTPESKPGIVAALRLTILMTDSPYPANHGGRVDRWDRLRGLASLGVHIQLVVWTGAEGLSPTALGALQEQCTSVIVLRRQRRIRGFLRLHPPGRLDSYVPSRRDLHSLEVAVKDFRADWIVADGIETSLLAQRLAALTGARLAYRSQNIEYVYWRFQRQLAKGLGKLPFLLAEPGMERAERALREKADLVLDISESDLSWWAARLDTRNAVALPPTFVQVPEVPSAPVPTDIDISFTGGLYAPNNVQGLEWYLDLVAPRVRTLLGRSPRCVFAGASPSTTLLDRCRTMEVECVANPASLSDIRRRSCVLVNPVQHSSGVNIKMLEMLAIGRPIVSTPAGVHGLPAALRVGTTVRPDPDGFAQAIVDAVRSPATSSADENIAALDRECGVWRLSQLVTRMASKV